MNTNEIVVNEDVIEVTDEIATAGSGKGFKMLAGIGLTAIGGYIAYKYMIKPMVAKIKAQKEQQRMDAEFDEVDDAEIDE